jgi:NAD+ kinase
MSPIKRIGIVLKPNQPDALRTVCELVTWLNERSITLVGTPELERDRIENETGCPVDQAPREDLAANVDLILVLGGDGTMIATARMLGDREVPVLGVNYGGLGYLAEFRIEELYQALESILAGNFRLDKRVMLVWNCVGRRADHPQSRAQRRRHQQVGTRAHHRDRGVSQPALRQFFSR